MSVLDGDGDNLHEMSNLVFWEPIAISMNVKSCFLKKKREKNISECRLLKILPRVLSDKLSVKIAPDIFLLTKENLIIDFISP